MKIGMLLDAVFPPDPRVENEALTLIKAGHEVYLFCLHYGEQLDQEVHKGIFVKRYESSKIEYKLSALAYTFPFYKNILAKKISHFLELNSIEAIHVHDLQLAGAAFKANTKFQLPIHLDLHENRPEIMKFYSHLNKFPGKFIIFPSLWKYFEQKYVEKYTKTIVVTKEAKQDLLSRCNISEHKIVVVPNTVHRSFYKDALFDSSIIDRYVNDFVILYLGDTGLRRGLMTVIESLSNLKEFITNLKLVIVGTSSEDEVLHNKVKELNLERYVDFEGWRDVSLFPSYIKASKICVSPLHKNKHHDTTYANKIFQYMSFAKPILVSDVTAQKNIVAMAHSGLTHKAEDAFDFEKNILQLYRDQSLQQEYGANGNKFIENEFTWEHTSKNLLNLYKNLDS